MFLSWHVLLKKQRHEMIDLFGDKDRTIGEMVRGKRIQQTFVASGEKLNYIDIEFATYQRTNDCLVVVDVFDGQKVIKQEEIDCNELEDNSFYRFHIEKKLDKGKVYEIRLHSPNGRGGNAVTMKFGRPRHNNMWLRLNGAEVRGELCCIIYYDDSENTDDFKKIAKYETRVYDPKNIPLLSVIIPTATRLDHLKTCLDTITENTDDYEAIVVINTPERRFREDANKLLSLYNNVLVITIPNFAGYVIPCNMGAAISSGRYICILNDDVIVKKGWDISMIEILKKDQKIGQVGPSLAYLKEDFSFSPYPTEHPYIEGWCFTIPRSIYEMYGLFDPQIDFAYCEDSDFSTKILANGFKVEKSFTPILHIGHQTSKKSGNEMKLLTDDKEHNNKKYLRKKWKDILYKGKTT